MCRVPRRRGAGDRGGVSSLPPKPAEVLIGPNSELFGSKLHATIPREPATRWLFYRPAKGQPWRGFRRGLVFRHQPGDTFSSPPCLGRLSFLHLTRGVDPRRAVIDATTMNAPGCTRPSGASPMTCAAASMAGTSRPACAACRLAASIRSSCISNSKRPGQEDARPKSQVACRTCGRQHHGIFSIRASLAAGRRMDQSSRRLLGVRWPKGAQMSAGVLIGPNSESFGCRFPATLLPVPGA